MLFRRKWFVAFFLLTIITPICITYLLHPISFNYTWKGRILYLFFLWLVFLEIVLVWNNFVQKDFSTFNGGRIFVLIALAVAPSLYVVMTSLRPVNKSIVEFGRLFGAASSIRDPNARAGFLESYWPLSLEYLALALLFTLFIWFTYEKSGLRYFAVSLFFLGAIGTVYTVDTWYPFGAFTPFQAFVPFTASAAEQVLKWMGYKASWAFEIYPPIGVELPLMSVKGNSGGWVSYFIGWPCAGVQSLFIYTFTFLLLLKRMNARMVSKAAYFVIGAIGTYIVNILRVVSIFLIGIHQGQSAATTFHDFYGEFYAMAWIVLYLVIVVVVHKKWGRLKRADIRMDVG